jgi:hypothetical protein
VSPVLMARCCASGCCQFRAGAAGPLSFLEREQTESYGWLLGAQPIPHVACLSCLVLFMLTERTVCMLSDGISDPR